MRKVLFLLCLFVPVGGSVAATDDAYPARCHTSTELNVRSGAGTNYGKRGVLRKGESITVLYLAGPESKPWGAIDYGTKRGYVSMKYVCYDEGIKGDDRYFYTTRTDGFRKRS